MVLYLNQVLSPCIHCLGTSGNNTGSARQIISLILALVSQLTCGFWYPELQWQPD